MRQVRSQVSSNRNIRSKTTGRGHFYKVPQWALKSAQNKNIRRRVLWDFSTSTCTEFVEVLSSKAPVPGGGGASALVGAVGTALGNMVGSLTVGKKKYADVEDEMWELKNEM